MIAMTNEVTNRTCELQAQLIKKLMQEIPDGWLAVRKKSNFKFYSLHLETLDSLRFQESLKEIKTAQP